MARRQTNTGESPTVHTVLISTPLDMWLKLLWDFRVFRNIQASYPDDQQPLVYASINVCIASSSLEDYVMLDRPVGMQRESVRSKIRAAVPNSGVLRDIANTAKHASHREEYWTGGKVVLRWQDSSEDGPSTFVLEHEHRGEQTVVALTAFENCVSDWWKLLVELGLASGPKPVPEWYQRELRAMFSGVPELQSPGFPDQNNY